MDGEGRDEGKVRRNYGRNDGEGKGRKNRVNNAKSKYINGSRGNRQGEREK